MNASAIKVIIADDFLVVGDSISWFFGQQDSFIVIDCVTNKELLRAVREKKPDAVIINILRPRSNSLSLIQQLAVGCPQLAIVTVSLFTEPVFIMRIIEAGARAYVVLGCYEEILKAVEAAVAGDIYYCSKAKPHMAKFLDEVRLQGKKSVLLTAREEEILKLMWNELTIKAIAWRVKLKDETIKDYYKRIKRKLEVKSIAGMVKSIYEKYMYLLNGE